jgi:arsenate reductase
MTARRKVLFLCTGNSARSQMAEALLNHLAGDRFQAHSAGLEPKGVHPMTLQVLEEIDVDASKHTSKHVRDYLGKEVFADLITVCDHADENCPTVFPGVQRRYHWGFEDPAAATGTEDERIAKFRKVRDQIKARIAEWLDNPSIGLRP